MTKTLRNSGIHLCLIAVLVMPLAASAQSPGERFNVFVSAPMRDGFLDTNKDVQESIKDIASQLRSMNELQIVDSAEKAQVVLTIAGRGVGPKSYANTTLGSLTDLGPDTFWLAAIIQSGDYTREISASSLNLARPSTGAWTSCAEQIADNLRIWILTNARLLKTPRTVAQMESAPRTSDTPAKSRVVSSGSGFFISDDGLLLTAAHVVADGNSISVKVGEDELPARIVKIDVMNDIAILKVTGSFHYLPLGNAAGVKLGSMVFTIGYPEPEVQGVAPKLTRGEINSLAGLRDDPRKFQISTPIQPGNSGGPIVDELGNVLGIVESSLDAGKTFVATGGLPQNVNFAVKISYARVLLETISALRLPSPSVVSPGFDVVVERALSASALVIAKTQ
jgi:S1-C subfamily serine protease